MPATKTWHWGIIGTGRIASDFITALAHVSSTFVAVAVRLWRLERSSPRFVSPSRLFSVFLAYLGSNCYLYLVDAKVVAIGGSSKKRAEEFASEHGVARSYGSYEEVAADSEVEIVYVATLHPKHKEAALTVIKHNKPVLVEKPLAMNASDAADMIDAAHKQGVFFMEAMWTRYFPAIQALRQVVKEGRIGDVLSVDARLGFRAGDNKRLNEVSQGASALLDVGVYTVACASMFLGPGAPEDIQAVAMMETAKENNNEHFDRAVVAVLRYPKGLATMQASFENDLGNTATIVGTKGRIHWKNHWSPDSFTIIYNDGTEEHFGPDNHPEFKLPDVGSDKYNFGNSQGLSFEARYCQEALERGLKESEHQSHEESLVIMRTLDKITQIISSKAQ